MGWLGSCHPVRNALKLNNLTLISILSFNLYYLMQMLRGLFSTQTINLLKDLVVERFE